MALKFLNKKGWHTGSLRNIENVWKAEQKHAAEQNKLEELRKQIQEERERSEFRQLQEQAGLVPRQERLDFLYESGLGVGKSSEGFKALETPTAATASASASAEAGSSKAAVPGALFEDKPQSANDTWRKLHSDPLLLIRQREQEALARIKNNPVQMAMIRKSVEAENKHKKDKGKSEKKKHKKKHHSKLKDERKSDSENTSDEKEDRRKRNYSTSDPQKHSKRCHSPENNSDNEERRKTNKSDDEEDRRRRKYLTSDLQKHRKRNQSYKDNSDDEDIRKTDHLSSNRHTDRYQKHESRSSRSHYDSRYQSESEEDRRNNVRLMCGRHHPSSEPGSKHNMDKVTHTQNQIGPGYNRRNGIPKMTEEEREARLKELQLDAELHEEQRWKRIKTAAEDDAREAAQAKSSGSKNFLDAAQKSIYGTEKGGSSTIEESVRRRAYYSQGGRAAHESNAFRR